MKYGIKLGILLVAGCAAGPNESTTAIWTPQEIKFECAPKWWGDFSQWRHTDDTWVELIKAAKNTPRPPDQDTSCLDHVLVGLHIYVDKFYRDEVDEAAEVYNRIVVRALGATRLPPFCVLPGSEKLNLCRFLKGEESGAIFRLSPVG